MASDRLSLRLFLKSRPSAEIYPTSQRSPSSSSSRYRCRLSTTLAAFSFFDSYSASSVAPVLPTEGPAWETCTLYSTYLSPSLCGYPRLSQLPQSDLYFPASCVTLLPANPIHSANTTQAVYAENWRWSQWEILWMSGPIFLLFFFFLPETHPSNILLKRAARLRKASGNEKIRSQTEIDRKGLTLTAVIIDAIIKPIEICIKDPAILFVNIYTALTYGIYYSFFEVFPLVYPVMYGFNVGETSIVFLCIIVGCILGMAIYFSYVWWVVIPDVLKNGLRAQEYRLRPALIACQGPVVGLFIFGKLKVATDEGAESGANIWQAGQRGRVSTGL